MRIKQNLQNFLFDQEYYIDIFANNIHIYHYLDLLNISDTCIKLKLEKFTLEIEGDNLCISSMDKREILIKGLINNVRFIR